MDKISEMLDDEFDALCDMEQRGEMLNGKELPTKSKYARFEEVIYQKASPAISANCGPGSFGLIFAVR